MSDREPATPEPTAPAPPAPASDPNEPGPADDASVVGWKPPSRVIALSSWFASNRGRYTDEALERSALAGGYTPDEIATARALIVERQEIKSRARLIVLAAYALVWVLFAIPYLWLTPPPSSGLGAGWGAGLQIVLTIALAIGLAISAVALRALHPDPSRAGRALIILLVVPAITLLAISGLCLPFVRSA